MKVRKKGDRIAPHILAIHQPMKRGQKNLNLIELSIPIKPSRLKLNERALPEARLQQLQILKRLNEILLLASNRPNDYELQELVEEVKEDLKKSMFDNAQFTAANRYAINSDFQYVIS